jgi:hypothetical protein
MSAHRRVASRLQPPAPFGLREIESPPIDPAATVTNAGQHLFSLFREELLRFAAQRSAKSEVQSG